MTALYDRDTEAGLLAAILMDPTVLKNVLTETTLHTRHFHAYNHQPIWTAILNLSDRGDQIDGRTLRAELERTGTYEKAGGDNALQRIWDAYDGSYAAVPYARRTVELAELRTVRTAGKQLADAADKQDAAGIAAAENLLAGRSTTATVPDTPDTLRELIADHLENRDTPAFPFPFEKLNDMSGGGMRPGETTLLGGWTSHGKSVLLDQILESAVHAGATVHLYINEMVPKTRGLRTISRRTGIPLKKLLMRDLDKSQHDRVIAELNLGLPYGITQCSGWDARKIARDMLFRRHQVVGVDILHLIEHNEERDLAAISQALTEAARVTGCHLIATVHLNEARALGDYPPAPVLRDIRGSGMLKNDADNVLFIYRESADFAGQKLPGEDAACYLAKCRSGQLGGPSLRFVPNRMSFTDQSSLRSVA